MVNKVVSYDIDLKIKDALDLPKNEYKDLDDFCDMEEISISEFLNECFKDILKELSGTKNIDTLMSRNKKFKDAKYIIKTQIKEEAGIPRQGLSKLMRAKIKEKIENED